MGPAEQPDSPRLDRLRMAEQKLAASGMLASGRAGRAGGGGGANAPGDAVSADVNDLMAAIDRLDSYMGQLKQRLEPLCRPDGGPTVGGEVASKLAPRSPFAQMLQMQTNRLCMLGWALHDILDRLEV